MAYALPSYWLYYFGLKIKVTPSILVFLGAVTFYFLVVVARTDLITSIMSIKIFFGSILFLFFLHQNYD